MLIEYLEDFYRAEAKQRQEQPNNPFRASAMGRCIREGCFDLLGLKGAALQPRRIAVFKHGDNIHDVLTDDLKQALGWRFVDGLAFKDNFVEIDGAKISYHIDGAFQDNHACSKVLHDPYRDGYLHSEDDDAPYDVDGIKYCGRCHRYIGAHGNQIGIVEIKSMSDFAFDRARKGEIDRDYLAQAWIYYKGTDFNPVVFICYRKETSHMVELVFDRTAPEKIVTQRLTGDAIELAKQDPLLVTEIRTPFDPSVEEYVRERICWLKKFTDKESPLFNNPDIDYIVNTVPGADAVEDEVIKVQGRDKALMRKEQYKSVEQIGKSAWYAIRTGRKILGFPCSYCVHMKRCFPTAEMEMDGDRPKWVQP